ncbi:putative leucine-rich repeat-containing protein DDB_G0290503 isoform X2 [Leptidea sinapis]|uniref:putative leucine-rich repeat-containing protein DDB_G0290503 isoform X2 n=1 Tax=Leptidea sinapis TaxID=189913 RepID=UPI0021C3EE18|nr:putative leucine-rich repeat-containing protein DDB_G0290503 isoform X2 [Leptidea sinapis]
MSRCDYDIIFYRVFCVTLLGIALIFTVILTNVFINIDGLLSRTETSKDDTVIHDTANMRWREKLSDVNVRKNEMQYDDGEDDETHRNKRSIMEQLDEEEMSKADVKPVSTDNASVYEEKERAKEKEKDKEKDIEAKDKQEDKDKNYMLHLAMHNILLQGIIGHMDLRDVYKKTHLLMKVFYGGKNYDAKSQTEHTSKENLRDTGEVTENPCNVEGNFLNELLNCQTLEHDIQKGLKNYSNVDKKTNMYTVGNGHDNTKNGTKKQQEPTLYIKTIIEINDSKNIAKENDSNSRDIRGLIKLIYNGKSVKFDRIDDIQSANDQINRIEEVTIKDEHQSEAVTQTNVINTTKEQWSSDTLVKSMMEALIKQKPYIHDHNLDASKGKRLKREANGFHKNHNEIKIKPPHKKSKQDDDELFIEIETHFDGKGTKGEKKKKIVRNLIDKIQKAIRSDLLHGNKKIEKYLNIAKRHQDPIESKRANIIDHLKFTLGNIQHRQVNPISKTSYIQHILDKNGNSWRRKDLMPAFLSIAKSVNSAELSKVLTDFDNVGENGIPERFQNPMNVKYRDEINVQSAENSSIFLKDIDGTGFSIGINQYEGEPPDKDSLQLFNGLESLIREFHKRYDSNYNNDTVIQTDSSSENELFTNREQKSLNNFHGIFRRSVDNKSNLYRNFLEKLLYPFYTQNTQVEKLLSKNKLYENCSNPSIINIISKPVRINDLSIAFNNNIFNEIRPLKNSKSMSISRRKKRSLKIKKISNMNSKMKMSKYMNTKTIPKKLLYINNKRHKRNVNKIKIIARERQEQDEKLSSDNKFLIDGGKHFSKNTNSNQDEPGPLESLLLDNTHNSQVNPVEEDLPFGYPDTPFLSNTYEKNKYYEPHLMEKYPHIIFGEMSPSNEYTNEESETQQPNRMQEKFNQRIQPKHSVPSENVQFKFNDNTGIADIIGALVPKSKFKLSVKLSPKNISDMNTGFKEIHTSVNKSYNRNGVHYITVLNVSQISKIENINKTSSNSNSNLAKLPINEALATNLQEREDKMKILLHLHKKRIDNQLNILQKEKNVLETISDNDNNMYQNLKLLNHDTIEYNESSIDNLLRDIEKRFATTTTKHIKNPTDKIEHTTEMLQIIKFNRRTAQETTEKNVLVETIIQNNNVTKEILQKINLNTGLLQKFLEKLSTSLVVKAKEAETERYREILQDDWKNFAPNRKLFQKSEFQNSTHDIPFVYGYQNKAYNAIANVNNAPISQNPSENMIENNLVSKFNKSKFFIDDLEKPEISATIKVNATHDYKLNIDK